MSTAIKDLLFSLFNSVDSDLGSGRKIQMVRRDRSVYFYTFPHFYSYFCLFYFVLHTWKKTGKSRDSLVDRISILDEYPNLIKPEDLDFQT